MFSLLRIWAQLFLFWITHPGNTQDHSFASQHSGDVKRRKGLEAKGYLQDFPCIHSTQPFSGSLQPNFCVFFIFAYILFNQPPRSGDHLTREGKYVFFKCFQKNFSVSHAP